MIFDKHALWSDGGTRAQLGGASVCTSPSWPDFDVRRRTIPLRAAADPYFAMWVDTIGDGGSPLVSLDMVRHVLSEEELL